MPISKRVALIILLAQTLNLKIANRKGMCSFKKYTHSINGAFTYVCFVMKDYIYPVRSSNICTWTSTYPHSQQLVFVSPVQIYVIWEERQASSKKTPTVSYVNKFVGKYTDLSTWMMRWKSIFSLHTNYNHVLNKVRVETYLKESQDSHISVISLGSSWLTNSDQKEKH